MKLKPILISLLIAGIGYGAAVLYRQVTLLKNSCVKLASYRFQKFSLKDATLIIKITIKNNSDIDLTIKNTDLNANINGTFVSKITNKENVTLSKKSETNIDLTINFNPTQVIKTGLSEIFTTGTDLQINIQGKLTVVSSLILISNLKIDETIKLSDILSPSNDSKC